MFQYLSETWKRSLLSTTLVTSVELPALLHFLKTKAVQSIVVDIWAVRGSLCILVVGFVFWFSRDVVPVVLYEIYVSWCAKFKASNKLHSTRSAGLWRRVGTVLSGFGLGDCRELYAFEVVCYA